MLGVVAFVPWAGVTPIHKWRPYCHSLSAGSPDPNVSERRPCRGRGGPVRQAGLSRAWGGSVGNGFLVSAGTPGFGRRGRKLPSRLRAGTQHPLTRRPSGLRFRFVHLERGLCAASPDASLQLESPGRPGPGWSPLRPGGAHRAARERLRDAWGPQLRARGSPARSGAPASPLPWLRLHSRDRGDLPQRGTAPRRPPRPSSIPRARRPAPASLATHPTPTEQTAACAP